MKYCLSIGKKAKVWIGGISCGGKVEFFNPAPSPDYDLDLKKCQISVSCPSAYTDWDKNEPNNANTGEKFIEIWGQEKWNDVECWKEYSSVCQKDAI